MELKWPEMVSMDNVCSVFEGQSLSPEAIHAAVNLVHYS